MKLLRGSATLTVLLLFPLLVGVAGCNRQQKSDTGKTYSPDKKQGGGDSQSGGSGGQSQNGQSQGGQAQTGAAASDSTGPQTLNSPADTTNTKSSAASDSGTVNATRGQVVAEPGAPVEHKAKKR